MSLLRKTTRQGYTHINNELLDATHLSFRARGVATFLLSKPDDWVIKIDYLVTQGTEGREAVRAALHELAEHGFLMRDRVTGEDGHITTVTYVADYPAYLHVGNVDRRILGYESTDLPENRSTVNRTVENPQVLVNTDNVLVYSSKRKGRKKYSEHPTTDKPRSYHPEDYDDL